MRRLSSAWFQDFTAKTIVLKSCFGCFFYLKVSFFYHRSSYGRHKNKQFAETRTRLSCGGHLGFEHVPAQVGDRRPAVGRERVRVVVHHRREVVRAAAGVDVVRRELVEVVERA